MRTIRILYCLISFMLLGASRAKAQTWEQLNDSFYYYYQRDDYKQALPVAQKIVEMARNDFGEADQQYATALNNLAYTYYKARNLAAAEDNFLECFTVKLKVYEPEDERCLSTAQMLSDIYKEQQNYKEAEKLLTGYLQVLSKKNKQQSKAFVYSLYMRGDSYRVMQQNERAITDFLGVLSNENAFITDTALLYGAYEALADLYGDVSDKQKGEKIFLRHAALCKTVDGEQSENYVLALFRLAGFYGRTRQYLSSQQTLDKVVDWYGKNKGTESEEYLSAYNNSMLLLCKLGNYTAADSMMDAQLLRLKKKLGENSSAFENAVYKAGIIFMQANNYLKCEEYFKKSISLSRQLNKPALLISRLNVLDSLYDEKNRTEDRIPVLEEMVAMDEKQNLLTDSVYAAKLLFLGNSYRRSGYSQKAVELVPKIDSASRKAYPDKTNSYIDSRTIIANIYVSAGMLDKADNYYQQSLRLAAVVWKDKKERYAGLLKVVGQMYNQAGFYKKAEEMLEKARQWMEESNSTDYNDWASVYYQLADIKSTLEKKSEAETAYRNAVVYAQKDTSLFYTFIQNATLFANFCTTNKLFAKADSLHNVIAAVTNNPGNQSYNVFLSNLLVWGLNKIKSGDSAASVRLIDSAIQLAQHYYINNQNWDDGVLFQLSQYYRFTRQYDKAVYYAEIYYRQAAADPGKDENVLFAPRIMLLFACLHAGQYGKAEEMITAMNKSSLQHMLNNLDAFSDAEREKYLFNKIKNIHLSNTLLLRNKNASPAFLKESFNELLLLRSLILAENRKLLESVISGGDTSLQRLYGQWLSVRTLLSREYAKPATERKSNITLLEEEAENLQKEMNQKSAFLRGRQQRKTITLTEVQSALQEDEAAIEFVSFTVTNEKNDSIMYAAHLLLKNNPLPVFVPLCTQSQLQKLFDSAGTTATGMVSRIYRGIDLGSSNTTVSLGKELYNLIWAPLEPHLKGIKKISYSPAGKLFNIAFHALPADSNLLLMDKYELRQYFSTKQVVLRNEIVSTNTTTPQPKSISLFGGASFDLAGKITPKQSVKNKNTTGFYLPESRGGNNSVWSALPGTAEEVKKIKKQFELNKVPAKIYSQSAASEENLKALSGNSTEVLHIATHGFFLPEPEKKEEDKSAENKNVYTLANDPLLRSGLILSGGNHVWSGKTPIEGVEDGIATAYEISQLNLSNTELVVLSACETALGDVRGSEGVFGLQRAFKMAGVKKMIVSLWQVPDKETAELMTSFYSYWLKGKTIEQAFAQAQAEMRKKYSPYYWAAFVLVE